MLKANARLSSALLALALSMLASQAARAQESPNAATTTAPASNSSVAGGAHDKPEGQQTQQPTQTGGTSKQNPNLPAPLTAGEKVRGAFRGALLSPVPYAMSAFTAGITQLGEDRLPHKDNGDEVADWGSRAARNFATRTTSTAFIRGIYPALFKQDPRYEPSRSKKFGPRVAHALGRVFVTRDDDGNLEPNYSRFAGAMTASAMANIWERSTPGRDRIGADATMVRFGRSFINAAIGNIVLREFGPDIIGIFRR
ncbi:MAG TPA: hypothetical protein VM936_07160 [Pyrinomonadaceae bacterium]|jgi:hypothetical protein|nr:hypothetical protein [Pyrinomonadaceae bacterium]